MQAWSYSSSKDRTNTFLLVLGYGLFLYMAQFFLNQAGMVPVVPSAESLNRYDATIYKELSEIGYNYHGDLWGCNVGWYILFPWVWKLSHLGVIGISIFNLVLFALSFAMITDMYPVSVKEKMLWLSTPSLYFMWVPYSEALFCFLCVLAMYGIVTQKRWLVWTGLFFVSLTRATAVFLLPAMLVMELLANDRRYAGKAIVRYVVDYAFPALAGTAVFVLVQYYNTGVWFIYFKHQATIMAHKFAMPVLPFSNYYGENRITWLSGLALCVCAIALIAVVVKGFKWLFKNEQYRDRVFILSLVYLAVTLFIMVFCNPTWGSLTTNLLGLHRYSLCSPFIFVFLYYFAGRTHNYTAKHFLAVFVLCNIVWLGMGSYLHIQRFLFYNFLTLLVFGYMLHANKKAEWVTYALIAINVFFQVSIFQQYLRGLFTD